ncbi:MAG: YabP/YqfC family sporulation protein [Clostridia bacterium]|nr:YabP/YqfC family sporulation protein [Clostridia bacterium]MDD4375695.1 YabP/YqfC family sporulation protein [Clostridia bacterium]
MNFKGKIKKKEMKEKVRDKINKILELPLEVTGDKLRITMIGNEYILVEGKSKVADYYDHYIKLKTEEYSLGIDGKNLSIKEISDIDLIINGEIINVSYI